MANIAFIIGNGFDVDLGLPSKYSQFIKGKEWADVLKTTESRRIVDEYSKHSLIQHLMMSALLDPNWFDIEKEIDNFVVSHPNCSDDDVMDIKNDYLLLTHALTSYLKRITDGFLPNRDKLSYKVMKSVLSAPHNKSIINFNYTDPLLCMKSSGTWNGGEMTFVHGDVRSDNIVIGCDARKDHFNRQLSFLYKYNNTKGANHINKNLEFAKEVIIFGHSINDIDFCYFKNLFEACATKREPARNLTIFTWNEKNAQTILDNIQEHGIPVTDLKSRLLGFDIICSELFYKGDNETLDLWASFQKRLDSKWQ